MLGLIDWSLLPVSQFLVQLNYRSLIRRTVCLEAPIHSTASLMRRQYLLN